MPLITFDYEPQENVGGLACSKITLIALDDIVKITNTTISYANAYELYFTEDTAVHTEKQKRTIQGIFFEQNIDFIVPKRRQEVREWIDQHTDKYFYVQYTDANGYSIEIPIMQLITDSTTGRRVNERNETQFSLDGKTLKKAKQARTIINSEFYQIGNGLFFDGVNDNVSVPYNPNFEFEHTDSFSVACWLKTGTSLTGTFGGNNIAGTSKTSPNFSGWQIYYTPTGKPNIFIFKAFGATPEQGEVYDVNYNFATNTLYHIVAVYSNHTYKFYVNGVLQTGTVSGFVTESIKAGRALDIGGGRNASNSINFDTMIFNKDLSQSEVTDLFNLIIPASALGNLVLRMTFEGLYKTGANVFTPELVIGNDGQLIGYPTSAKGIVDTNNNNIQLVP